MRGSRGYPVAQEREGDPGPCMTRRGFVAKRERSLPASCSAGDRLTLLPFHELAEQRLSILRLGERARLIVAQELIEPAPRVGGGHHAAVAIEPFLRRPESRPAGQRRI